jgi:hypothetical protein
VPTSGVPTVTHTTTPPALASGSAQVAGHGSVTPMAGTPIIGSAGSATTEAPAGGRRSRPDDDQLRPSTPRRSTSLDDFEDPRPPVGRRAAPDLDDEAPAADRTAVDELTGDKPASHQAGIRETRSDDDSRMAGRAGTELTDARAGSTDPRLPAAEKPTAVTAGDDNKAPKRPGDVVETQIAFWDPEAITHFRNQWHEVKADFVDDPVTALTRAHDLLTDAVNELTESLLAERDELDPLQNTSNPDTESMRMAMRGYREFLDRILAL